VTDALRERCLDDGFNRGAMDVLERTVFVERRFRSPFGATKSIHQIGEWLRLKSDIDQFRCP
jgi:hypothetical protein